MYYALKYKNANFEKYKNSFFLFGQQFLSAYVVASTGPRHKDTMKDIFLKA